MKTIAQIVSKIISKNHFLREAINEDIANASKIARKIKHEVEEKVMEKVSDAAIIAAIRRLPHYHETHYKKDYTKKIIDIVMRSHLTEYQFYNPPNRFALHQTVLKTVESKNPEAYLNIVRGQNNTRIVVSSEMEKILDKKLEDQNELRKFSGLAALTLRLPEINTETAGVYYPFFKQLAWNGISFYETASVSNELTIVFEQKDIDRAFAIIKKMSEK